MEQTKYFINKITAERFQEKYFIEAAPKKFQKGMQKLTEFNEYLYNKYDKKDENETDILQMFKEQMTMNKKPSNKISFDSPG